MHGLLRHSARINHSVVSTYAMPGLLGQHMVWQCLGEVAGMGAHIRRGGGLLRAVGGRLEEVLDDLFERLHVDLLADVPVVDETVLRRMHAIISRRVLSVSSKAVRVAPQQCSAGGLANASAASQRKRTLANRPFLSSTHRSTYLNMMVSSIFCHVRCRLLVMTSCRACSAAWGWPTAISSSARFKAFSGLVNAGPPRWKRDMMRGLLAGQPPEEVDAAACAPARPGSASRRKRGIKGDSSSKSIEAPLQRIRCQLSPCMIDLHVCCLHQPSPQYAR